MVMGSAAAFFHGQLTPRSATRLASVTDEPTIVDIPTIMPVPEDETTTTEAWSGNDLMFKRYEGTNASVLFPSLARPPLLDGTHAGDYGFDPLGIAETNKELYDLMEAEIRHGRLAMLCAAGWPMAELRPLFDGALLADGGRAPSVLNGHLFDSPSLVVVLAIFAEVGFRDLQAIQTPKQLTLYGHIHAQDYEPIQAEWPWGVPGDLSFDPLGLYGIVGKDAVGRKVMRDLEINHGRVAMLAVLCYVVLEATTGRAVVDITPFLFWNF